MEGDPSPVILVGVTTSPLGTGPLVYAHRGDRSRAADNTLEAYRLAVEAGTDGIELDVRRTADGVLIVSHDDHVPGLDPFAAIEFGALRAMAPQVPTLQEAMEAIPAHVFVNVEIKNFPYDAGYDTERTIVDETLDALSNYDDPGRILLSSFDVASVQRAGEVAPGFLSGQLLLQAFPLDAGMAVATQLGADALIPHLSHVADDAMGHVAGIRDSGLAVVVWGVDTPEDVALVASADVNAVITDDPAMARSVIGQR